MCVSVSERERERVREAVCVAYISVRGKNSLSVRETAIHGKRRERKRNWVCFMRERERQRVRETVCVRGRG